MMELISTGLITATSILLFGYWFRYTCMLILSAKTTKVLSGVFAASGELAFADVQSQLSRAGEMDLNGLKQSLDRDFALLQRMLEQTAHLSLEESSVEQLMLRLNYKVSGAWYRLSCRVWPTAARQALEDMSQVVAHFASVMGERAAVSAAA